MTWQVGPHPDSPPPTPHTPNDAVRPSRPRLRRDPVALRPRADTPQATTLALLPLLPPALGMMSVLFAGGWSLSTVGALAVATALLQFGIARRDVRALDSRGFAGNAPAALALVSPILYLAVRARRCAGHDSDAGAPVPWAIASTAIAIGVIVIGTWFEAAIGGLLESV